MGFEASINSRRFKGFAVLLKQKVGGLKLVVWPGHAWFNLVPRGTITDRVTVITLDVPTGEVVQRLGDALLYWSLASFSLPGPRGLRRRTKTTRVPAS